MGLPTGAASSLTGVKSGNSGQKPKTPAEFLESTTVLFGSGMGDANSHKNSDLPIILAGGGYQHGEFRQVPREGAGKVPLCNLFVDIAQKMGLEIEHFGGSTGRFA